MHGTQDISVEAYGACERRALDQLSNDHIRAFSPVTFIQHGYPASAESDRAVARYVDTMQELNDPVSHYEKADYTPDEAGLISQVNDAVLNHTRASFGRAIRPWMGPLATINLFRAIQVISAAVGKPKLRIFEVGPGSGYLGALLLRQGHEYLSTDIAQGFYLWQSRLMRVTSTGGFIEGALQDRWPYPGQAPAVHVPWWHFATLYRSDFPEVDVVVCDHALGEMHPYALRYLCRAAQLMVRKASPGFVIYTSIGEPRFHSEEAIRLNFERTELHRSVTGKVSVFSQSKDVAPEIQALAETIPVFNPKGVADRLKASAFIPIRADEAPVSYELYKFLDFDTPPGF